MESSLVLKERRSGSSNKSMSDSISLYDSIRTEASAMECKEVWSLLGRPRASLLYCGPAGGGGGGAISRRRPH